MALRLCALVAGFSTASGMNIVNRKSGMCLDIHATCVDGVEVQGCERRPAETLESSANLQLYTCNGKPNQDFELTTSGRIRNPKTGLCLDIVAPCKDHWRSPCERVAVSELKKEANIQLYKCHEDEGVLSNSYGNQKWNFEDGELRNWLSNLCLEPKVDSDGNMVKMANVQSYICKQEPYQKFDFMDAKSYDLDSGAQGDVADEVQEKFAVAPSRPHLQAKAAFNEAFLKAQNSPQSQALFALGAVSLVVVFVAMRRRAPPQQGELAMISAEDSVE